LVNSNATSLAAHIKPGSKILPSLKTFHDFSQIILPQNELCWRQGVLLFRNKHKKKF
jgi:hypothetical protein